MKFKMKQTQKEKKELIHEEILNTVSTYKRKGENVVIEIFGSVDKDIDSFEVLRLVLFSVNDGDSTIVLEEGHDSSNYAYGSDDQAMVVLDHFAEINGYRVYPVEVGINLQYIESDTDG